MSWVAVAVGAGAGLIKSQTVDKDKENRERTLAASTQRYSPWTGLKAGPVQEADPLGSSLQFATTGAQLKGAFQNSQAQQDLQQAQTGWLNRGGSPAATAAVNASAPGGLSGPAGMQAAGSSWAGGPRAYRNPWDVGVGNY